MGTARWVSTTAMATTPSVKPRIIQRFRAMAPQETDRRCPTIASSGSGRTAGGYSLRVERSVFKDPSVCADQPGETGCSSDERDYEGGIATRPAPLRHKKLITGMQGDITHFLGVPRQVDECSATPSAKLHLAGLAIGSWASSKGKGIGNCHGQVHRISPGLHNRSPDRDTPQNGHPDRGILQVSRILTHQQTFQ